MTKKISLLLVLALLLSLGTAAITSAEKPGDSIVDIALSDPDNFSTLVQAVIKADLVETLDGNRMFTVFAPTNDAFDAAASALAENMLQLDHRHNATFDHIG